MANCGVEVGDNTLAIRQHTAVRTSFEVFAVKRTRTLHHTRMVAFEISRPRLLVNVLLGVHTLIVVQKNNSLQVRPRGCVVVSITSSVTITINNIR